MVTPPSQSITALLQAWGQGDDAARERLVLLVYDQLRLVAARQLRGERPNHTLQPTALVHEVYLRLVEQEHQGENRQEFFGLAACLMRRVLVDYARARAARKRGGGLQRVSLDGLGARSKPVDVIALDEALERLADLSPLQARIVELRYFGGMSIAEAAEAVDASPATVKRAWTTARAWLYDQLRPGEPPA